MPVEGVEGGMVGYVPDRTTSDLTPPPRTTSDLTPPPRTTSDLTQPPSFKGKLCLKTESGD